MPVVKGQHVTNANMTSLFIKSGIDCVYIHKSCVKFLCCRTLLWGLDLPFWQMVDKYCGSHPIWSLAPLTQLLYWGSSSSPVQAVNWGRCQGEWVCCSTCHCCYVPGGARQRARTGNDRATWGAHIECVWVGERERERDRERDREREIEIEIEIERVHKEWEEWRGGGYKDGERRMVHHGKHNQGGLPSLFFSHQSSQRFTTLFLSAPCPWMLPQHYTHTQYRIVLHSIETIPNISCVCVLLGRLCPAQAGTVSSRQ